MLHTLSPNGDEVCDICPFSKRLIISCYRKRADGRARTAASDRHRCPAVLDRASRPWEAQACYLFAGTYAPDHQLATRSRHEVKTDPEKALLALALKQPADERAPCLDAMCEGDPAPRQRLEARLTFRWMDHCRAAPVSRAEQKSRAWESL